MEISTKHIINVLKWDSSFDDRRSSNYLQDKLKDWTYSNMGRVIDEVLESMNIQNETIRFEQLILDIGVVNYRELEEEVSRKVKHQLSEQVGYLLFNSNSSKRRQILESKNEIDLDGIIFYLSNGYWPWYVAKEDSLEKIISRCIGSDRVHFYDSIARVLNRRNVIQRISWWLEDNRIYQIIEFLEPIHYNFIVDFRNSVVDVQKNENVVRTDRTNLEKYLNQWILEHLTENRGSVFNRISFMKSSVQKMASHFNLQYEKLLMLLFHSFEDLNASSRVHISIYTAIQTLYANEVKMTTKIEYNVSTKAYESYSLVDVLKAHNLLSSSNLKSILNDKVKSLSKEDYSEFVELVYEIGRKKEFWSKILDLLEPESMDHLFICLSIYNEKWTSLVVNKLREAVRKEAGFNQVSTVNWTLFNAFLKQRTNRIEKDAFLAEISSLFFESDSLNIIYSSKEKGKPRPEKTKLVVEKSNEDLIFNYNKVASRISEEEVLRDIQEVIKNILEESGIGSTSIGYLSQNVTRLVELLYSRPNALAEVLLKDKNRIRIFKAMNLWLREEDFEYLIRNSKCSIAGHSETVLKKLSVLKSDGDNFFENLLTTFFRRNTKIFLNKADISYNQFINYWISSVMEDDSLGSKNCRNAFLESFVESLKPDSGSFSFSRQLLISSNFSIKDFAEEISMLINKGKIEQSEVIALINSVHTMHGISPFEVLRNTASKEIQSFIVPQGVLTINDVHEILERHAEEMRRRASIPNILHLVKKSYWMSLEKLASEKSSSAVRFGAILESFLKMEPSLNELFLRKEGNNINEIRKSLGLVDIDFNEYAGLYNALSLVRGGANGKSSKTNLKKLIVMVLNKDVHALKEMFYTIEPTNQRIKNLSSNVEIKPVLDTYIRLQCTDIEVKLLYGVVDQMKHFGLVKTNELNRSLWASYWKGIYHSLTIETFLLQILKSISSSSSIAKDLAIVLNDFVKKNKSRFSDKILIFLEDLLKNMKSDKKKQYKSKIKQIAIENRKIDLYTSFLLHGEDFNSREKSAIQVPHESLVRKMQKCPRVMKSILRDSNCNAAILSKARTFLDVDYILSLLKKEQPLYRKDLDLIRAFYTRLEGIKYKNENLNQMVIQMHELLIKIWSREHFAKLNPTEFSKELLWSVRIKTSTMPSSVLSILIKNKNSIPLEYLKVFQNMYEKIEVKSAKVKRSALSIPAKNKSIIEQEGLYIQNAGLVLLNNYIDILFDRLLLTEGGSFNSIDSQQYGLHVLQYLTSGFACDEEGDCVLNKILCGFELHDTYPTIDKFDDGHIEVMDGLIEAVVGHWSSIGESSNDGFRGNWLIRNGVLKEFQDKWELTVEKRAYDLLINSSPFSFSYIKYAWMPKPLHVIWPY